MNDNFEVTTISAKQMSKIMDQASRDERMTEVMTGREITVKQAATLKKYGVELTGAPDCDRAQASGLIGLLKVSRKHGESIIASWREWGWAK